MNCILKLRCRIFLVFILGISYLTAGTEYIDQAWQEIANNNFDNAAQLLDESIINDKSPLRAYLTLSFISQLYEDYETAWEWYDKALKEMENYDPYIYAGALTGKSLLSENDNLNRGMLQYMDDLTNSKEASGVIKAMANEHLGLYHEEYGKLKKAEKYFDALGAITRWSLIGPFENISASGFDKSFPPELEFNPGTTYEGKTGVPANWFNIDNQRQDRWLDITTHFAARSSVFYGNTFVYSPEKQTVQVRVGTSGSLKVFVNDETVFSMFDENNNDIDTYIAETEFQKGWNRLLIKCGYSEINRCNFLVRLTDPNGKKLSGLKYSLEKQEYPVKPGASNKIIKNFAEKYFEDLIDKIPEIPENYLLLADCYLRNDKAVDAELVLRNLARKMPESVLVKYHLLEAYTRGEKFDEISTTMEMINNLLPELPGAVEFKYQEYMQIENYDQAEIMAEKYHRLKPGNMMDYTMQTTMALQKGNMDEAQAILKEGQKKHYLDWGLTQLWASLLSQTTKSQKAAIKVYKNYLKHRYYNEAVFVLANTYLYDSDIEGCEKTLNEYLKRNPSATGIYNSLGRIYFQTQDYKKAELNLNKALEQCPGYSGYWALLGEILQGQDNIEAAIAAYRTALSYDPKDYDTIARLRELEGKDNVFEYFDSPDIKKLWENASASEDYPEDNALFLFDMTKYVIYPEGGSEKEQEILIKVFNNDGISEFSEYWIDYYSSSEQLIVDKATVYKPDGTEIRGDVSSNQIVFKSLEPGDCIYVKHRIRNFNRGRLSRHLWDEFYFNYYYPVEDIRYEVLVPESFSVNFKTKNMPDEPVVSDTDFGRLYRWQLWDQPALEWEYDMPELKDVGKMFYISSIPDWQYLVDWYQDLASTKTRSSYEIEETVAEIMAGYENATDYEKIELVYNYITENINYSSVPFRQSGLIPQKARDVLVEKLGDCKDVATLAIAMLDELGITANYVLVNTVNEGLNRGILPALEFNHAIARAEYDGQEIYMDLTAQNYPLHTLPPMDQGAFILNIKPGIVEPGWITDEYYSHGATRRKTTVTIDEELTAVMVKENKRTGSPAAGFRRTYRYEGEKDRLKNLTKLMAERYPNSKVERFDIEDLNAIELEIDYSYQITAPNFLEEVGSMKLLQMPWSDRAEFLSALSYEKREFEFNYKTGLDTLIEEIEITFPAGFYPDDFESVTEYSSDIAAYSLTQDWSDDVFKVRREYIVHEHVVAPEDYADFKDFYNKVIKADERQILIKQE